MIRTGDTIENPVTGERITFLATSTDTGGEAVVIEAVVQPHGFVAAGHVHPFQSERFAVAAGTLGLKVGRKKMTLGPGEVARVEAGTAHRFWNAGEEQVRFVCEVRPALQFESLLETMFALAADGKTSRKGMPNPLRLAVIAQGSFRHRPASVSTGMDAERWARLGRAYWPPLRLRPDICLRGWHAGGRGALSRRNEEAILLRTARPGRNPARPAGPRREGGKAACRHRGSALSGDLERSASLATSVHRGGPAG
jgi:quercetin dioxygenase-like cupin family protein